MKKMNVKPLIISALTAVAFGAVGVGTTFALFTDKAETSISVQAGKVEIEDSIVIKSVASLNTTDTDTKIIPGTDDKQASFQNGGSVAITTNGGVKSVDIQKMTPGDKVVLEINEVNKSNVKIKTRFKATHTSTTNPDLFNALTITYHAVDKNNKDISYKFMDWNLLDIPAAEQELIAKITVTIEFKDHDNGQILFGNENHDNNYQNSNCSIVFAQEAVQGNAAVMSLIEEMNNELASQDVRNNTLTDALADVSELASAGDLEAAGYVWNSETDRFAYPQEVTSGTKYKYFKVYSEMPTTQTFSIYAYGWTTQATVNLDGVGFDAGNSTGINTINYVNTTSTAKTSIINSNSYLTTLTINAENDIVHHYGNLGYLNIIAVAGESYHENGKVAYTEIAKGRIVLENGSKVEEIHVNKKTDSSFDTVIIANNGGTEELPERITRDAVTVSEETLVVKVESNGSSENVYVYADGVSGTKGSTQKITEGENKQNENVNSALGQLVLDNGATADKAQTAEEKEDAKAEVIEEAIIEEIEEDDKYVARIGTAPFESLKDAVAGAVTNDVIEMTANDPSTENISVDKKVTINMNEKTFGGTIVVNVSNSYVTVNGLANIDAMSRIGNNYYKGLSVINNQEVFLLKDVSLNSLNVGTTSNWIFNLNGHSMTIGSARVQNDNTRGTLTLKNGDVRFTSTGSQSIEVNGTLNLDNVNVLESKANMVIKTIPMSWGDGSPIVQITDSIINSDKGGIENGYLNSTMSWSPSKVGSLTVANSTINANNGKGICNYGLATIEDCVINAKEDCSIYSLHHVLDVSVVVNGSNTFSALTTKEGASSNNVEIQGGTFTINGSVSFVSERQNSDNTITDLVVNGATATINGGSYESMTSSLGAGGNLRIVNGTFVDVDVFVTDGGSLLVLGDDEYDGIHHYIVNGTNGEYTIVQE